MFLTAPDKLKVDRKLDLIFLPLLTELFVFSEMDSASEGLLSSEASRSL